MNGVIKRVGAALVVGGGIGGMQAVLDLAEAGIKVYLVESKPAIGGVMSQLDKTFPTNECAMCTMAPRLVSIGRHKDIEVLTLTEVERIEGELGNFTVTLRRRARFVDESACTGCGSCVANCPIHFIPQPLDGGATGDTGSRGASASGPDHRRVPASARPADAHPAIHQRRLQLFS